ncbi:hypothetical protein D3C72_2406250 [compost metagenome]
MEKKRSEPIFSTGRMKPRLMRPHSNWRMMSLVEPLETCRRMSGYFRPIRDRNAGSTPVVAG